MTAAEIERLAIVGRWLYRSCLGANCEYNRRIFERMKSPQLGDIVLEITRFGPFDPESVGTFIRRDGEACLIMRLDCDEVQRWENAEFMSLPNTFSEDWLNDGRA